LCGQVVDVDLHLCSELSPRACHGVTGRRFMQQPVRWWCCICHPALSRRMTVFQCSSARPRRSLVSVAGFIYVLRASKFQDETSAMDGALRAEQDIDKASNGNKTYSAPLPPIRLTSYNPISIPAIRCFRDKRYFYRYRWWWHENQSSC
jgi:hypothetical protein